MAVIFIDLDDTTVDFLQGVCDIHNKELPLNQHKLIDSLDDWHKNSNFIDPYIKTEGLFLNLKIKPDAVEVLSLLNKRHDIKILTAFPTALSAKEKVEFVERHLPFIGVNNMSLSWDKGLFRGDVLFDDSPSFLPKFEGLKIAYNMPYNQHTQVDARVHSWVEFFDTINIWESKGVISRSK